MLVYASTVRSRRNGEYPESGIATKTTSFAVCLERIVCASANAQLLLGRRSGDLRSFSDNEHGHRKARTIYAPIDQASGASYLKVQPNRRFAHIVTSPFDR